MEICLAEALKRVKAIDTEMSELMTEERGKCQTIYRTQDEKITYDYDFSLTREKMRELRSELLRLKKAINKANNETLINVADYTISDGLVIMALINKEVQYHLDSMGRKEQFTSQVDMRNDSVIFTELLYDPKLCRQYVADARELLAKIQIGIDRANLTTIIEY